MRVSAGLPTGMEGLTYPIPFSDPENIIRIAQAAERFGYDSVWGNDHITAAPYVRTRFSDPPNFYEVLITMSGAVVVSAIFFAMFTPGNGYRPRRPPRRVRRCRCWGEPC